MREAFSAHPRLLVLIWILVAGMSEPKLLRTTKLSRMRRASTI